MSAIDHAARAAEAIRALNHATLPSTGYRWPSDVDAVIGELETLADRLLQALGQAANWLEQALEADRVGHDGGADVAETVLTAVEWLGDASSSVLTLAYQLRYARGYTTHLTGIDAVPGKNSDPSDETGSTAHACSDDGPAD